MPDDKPLKWWSSPRALMRHILGLDDTHHSIAMGTTVGMFIGMTPTVGIQMIIVMCVAILTKRFFNFNRVAALITVYISNPVTMIPIYYFDYWVGSLIFGGDVSRDDFGKILEYEDFAGWWTTIVDLFVGIGLPLVVGSIIVASVCSAITYPVMRWMLKTFRPDKDTGSSPETEDTNKNQTDTKTDPGKHPAPQIATGKQPAGDVAVPTGENSLTTEARSHGDHHES